MGANQYSFTNTTSASGGSSTFYFTVTGTDTTETQFTGGDIKSGGGHLVYAIRRVNSTTGHINWGIKSGGWSSATPTVSGWKTNSAVSLYVVFFKNAGGSNDWNISGATLYSLTSPTLDISNGVWWIAGEDFALNSAATFSIHVQRNGSWETGAGTTYHNIYYLPPKEFKIYKHGGTYDSTTATSTITQSPGTTYSLGFPTKTGYTFGGWAKSSGANIPTVISTDSIFESGNGGITVYNNSGNGTVTHTRGDISSDSTNEIKSYGAAASAYQVQIKTNGTASPGAGGFYLGINSSGKDNQKYRHVIYAKIPKGYTIQHAENATGNGRTITWLTSQEGTGGWTYYAYDHKIGSGGTMSTFGHVYLTAKSGYSNTSVTWQVAATQITRVDANNAVTIPNGSSYVEAFWVPNQYKITLNNQSATTAGTPAAWYRYNTVYNSEYYFSDAALSTPLSSGYIITKPTKTGYVFGGYYTGTGGSGTQYVTAAGGFTNNIYATTGDRTLYAKWIPYPTVTFENDGDLYYNGSAQYFRVKANTPGTFYISEEDYPSTTAYDYKVTISTANTWYNIFSQTNVGGNIYGYKFIPNDTANFATIDAWEQDLYILKGTNPLTFSDQSKSITYGGTSCAITAASNGAGAVTYALVSAKYGSTALSSSEVSVNSSNGTITLPVKDVGTNFTIIVRAIAAGNANYNTAVSAKTITISIGTKAITVAAVAKSKNYGASDPTLQFTFGGTTYNSGSQISTGVGSEKLTVTLSRSGDNNVAGTKTITGTAAAVSPAKLTNYSFSCTSANFTINKVAASVTAPTAKGGTYAGSAVALFNAGSVTGGTMYYYASTSSTTPAAASITSTSIPTGLPTTGGAAQKYYLWYKVVADGNHTGDVGVTQVNGTTGATVNPGTITVTKVPYSGNYDGSAHKASIKVNVAGCTVKSGSASGTYGTTDSSNTTANTNIELGGATRTNAGTNVDGTTTVYYQVSKTYYTTVTGSTTITIKALTSHTVTIYTASSGTGTVATGGSRGAITYNSTISTYPTASIAGSWAIPTSSNTSYVSVTAPTAATTTAANGRLTVTCKGVSYTTSNITITAVFTPTSTNYTKKTVTWTHTVAKVTSTLTFDTASGQVFNSNGATYTGSPIYGYATASVAGTLYRNYNGTQLTSSNYSTAKDATTSMAAGIRTSIGSGQDVVSNTVYYYFVPTDSTNYTVVQTSAVFKIVKANAYWVTEPVLATGLTYNGSEKTLISSWASCNGKGYGAIGTSSSTAPTSGWGTPKATNAGDYYIWVKIDGDSNYNAKTAYYLGKVTIAKATPTVTVTRATPKYAGSAVTLASATASNCTYYLGYATSQGGAITWLAANTSITSSTSGISAGTTYYIYYKATGNTNYNDIASTYSGTALYSYATYSITYDKGDATSGTAPAAQTKTYGKALTLATNTGSLAHSQTSGSTSQNAAITLTYNANSGSGAPANNTGTAVSISGTYPITWTIAGWGTSSGTTTATYSLGGSYTTNAAKTLYPAWTKTNGTTTWTAKSASATISSSVPTRTGYTFKGWSTSNTATTASYSSGGTYTESITANKTVTLYAVWEVNSYNITINWNGGSYTHTANSAYSSTSSEKYNPTSQVYGAWIYIDTPTKTGYTFAGWNVSGMESGVTHYYWANSTSNSFTGTTLSNTKYNEFHSLRATSGTVTFDAQWTANQYTVSYDANGGTGAPSATTITFNAGTKLSTTIPTKSGYVFTGWKFNTAIFQPGDAWPNGWGSATLIAQWNQIISVPTWKGPLTYTGSSQSATTTTLWNNYSTDSLTIGGTTSGTNAGSYSATFTPKAGYCWSDGTTTAKTINWTISKAASRLTLSETGRTIYTGATLNVANYVTNHDGTVTYAITSNGTTTASTISGSTVTAGAMSSSNDNNQTVTVTISDPGDGNHNAGSKTYTITVQKYTPTITFNNTTAYVNQGSTLSVAATATVTVMTSDYRCTSTQSAFSQSGSIGTISSAFIMANQGKKLTLSWEALSTGASTSSVTTYQAQRFGIHGYITINGSTNYPFTEALNLNTNGVKTATWQIPTGITSCSDLAFAVQTNPDSGFAKPASGNTTAWYFKNVSLSLEPNTLTYSLSSATYATISGSTVTGVKYSGTTTTTATASLARTTTVKAGSATRTFTVKDSIAPTPAISGGTTLKATSQTVTLTAFDNSNGSGIAKYYWGTSSGGTPDTTWNGTATTKTIEAAGTYYLRVADTAGNIGVTSITIVSYTVNNVRETAAGTAGTYTSANYTSVSSGTYIVKSSTTLTLSSVYTNPSSTYCTFKGYSTSYSTSATTLSSTNPTVSSGTTYYMWFDRDHVTLPSITPTSFTYNKSEQGPTLTNPSCSHSGTHYTTSGTAKATAANGYSISWTLKSTDNQKWTDNTTAAKTLNWTIGQKTVGLSWGTLTWTYNGSTRSTTCTATGVISGDTCTVTLTGNSVGPNVGTATVTASSLSNNNYKLPASKTATLTINKATPTLTLSPTAGQIRNPLYTKNHFTYSYSGDGTVSASSANTGIATTKLLNNLYTGERDFTIASYAGGGACFSQKFNCLSFNPAETVGTTYTISFWAKSPNGTINNFQLYNTNNTPRYFRYSVQLINAANGGPLENEWRFFSYTFVNTDRGSSYSETTTHYIELYGAPTNGIQIKDLAVVEGNTPYTDNTVINTRVADGTTTITVSAPATNNYNAISKTYNLNVFTKDYVVTENNIYKVYTAAGRRIKLKTKDKYIINNIQIDTQYENAYDDSYGITTPNATADTTAYSFNSNKTLLTKDKYSTKDIEIDRT